MSICYMAFYHGRHIWEFDPCVYWKDRSTLLSFIYPQPIPLHRHDCWLLVVICHLSSHLSTMIILIYTGYMIYIYMVIASVLISACQITIFSCSSRCGTLDKLLPYKTSGLSSCLNLCVSVFLLVGHTHLPRSVDCVPHHIVFCS